MIFATNGERTDFKGVLRCAENIAQMRKDKEGFLEDEISRPLRHRHQPNGVVRMRLGSASDRALKSHSVVYPASAFNSLSPLSTNSVVGTHSSC